MLILNLPHKLISFSFHFVLPPPSNHHHYHNNKDHSYHNHLDHKQHHQTSKTDAKSKEKSVLQAKLTLLAIRIGYLGVMAG